MASPKRSVRTSFQVGLLDEREAEHALALVDDRNLTVHTYNEDLAKALASRLGAHAILLRAWLERAREQAAERAGL